ncbi:glycosyltransferase family 2 protein [Cellulosimicrobium cellulans]|uniref:glycosyltransferase family 2 protein n=1 Tax=Cellulosimicrobium cellulans TaxID=1710 RepID=UPI001651C226|nr:glycosyltransferase [Cellulosimicrobium cellulans]
MTTPTRPRVSVVVPTNRRSPYLPDALASVRDQQFTDWEVVVVGDGVADRAGLEGTVRDVLGAHRATVLHVPPRGVSVARNAGTAVARGELIAYLDDDDVWHPERLARQVARLDADPAATACSSDGWVVDQDGERLDEPWPLTRGSRLDLLSGRVDIPRIVTLLFRRDEVQAIGGFHPAFRVGEDNELILRALLLGRFVAVPEALVGYRRHAGGVSATIRAEDDPGEQIITLTLDGARRAGDAAAVAALEQNLRRFRARSAASSARTARARARARDWGAAGLAGAAALRRSPAVAAHTLLLGRPPAARPTPPTPARSTA